jgi:hypothetical protein
MHLRPAKFLYRQELLIRPLVRLFCALETAQAILLDLLLFLLVSVRLVRELLYQSRQETRQVSLVEETAVIYF